MTFMPLTKIGLDNELSKDLNVSIVKGLASEAMTNGFKVSKYYNKHSGRPNKELNEKRDDRSWK
ncbi:hypothetical protein DPMN_021058 [Dreissena polymorpha]|uniref:Uncharacterized protein n=1 Tax=Dreissena polymorpha TaxID=45954 RepID=A0A9D4NLW2_DREPO|nr:hypothetical protein DPMN_020920 [Dreissena polymorpha]KAH3896875.1 hypothetical protein DPMN_021058 [Dreissena polymorpha]